MNEQDDNSHREDPLAAPPPPDAAPFVEDEDEEEPKHEQDNDDKEEKSDVAGVGTTVEVDTEALAEGAAAREEEFDPKQVRKNRVFMTILHFVLTYPRWSFSLFLLFANWTTPLPTSHERVAQPVGDLRAVVQTEAKLYHECVETHFRFQDVQMDRAAMAEQDRVSAIRAARQIAQIAEDTMRCYNATVTVQRSLQQWYGMGLVLPNKTAEVAAGNGTSACSDYDRERLNELLGADLYVLNNGIRTILDTYIDQSLKTLHPILQYSQDRSAYDYKYFVGVKMDAVIGVLEQFAAPNISLLPLDPELNVEIRIMLQELEGALRFAYVRIDLLTVRITEFEVSIQAFFDNYVELRKRFVDIRNFVKDLLPEGVPLPSNFDIVDIPLPNALLPPVFAVPQFGNVLPDVDVEISKYIEQAILLIERIVKEAAEEASEQTRRIIEEFIELLRGLTLLEDYDPPKYPRSDRIETPEDEVANLQSLADETRVETQEALDDITGLHENVPEPVPSDLEDVDTSIIEDNNNQTQFKFLDLGVPEIDIPIWILTVIEYVCSFSFLVEIVIQAVRFYRLKRKYEKNCVPELPEIDYLKGTEDDDDKKEKEEKENKPSKLEVAQTMLLKNAMNPMVIVGLILLPFVLSILFIWFPHVKASCIDSRRGTFLARRVIKQIQVNKANAQGYALHTVSQLRCHRKQRVICSRKSSESDVAFRNDAATLFALQTRFNESTATREVVDRCIDTGSLDAEFGNNCCGLEGYSHEGVDCFVDQLREFCPTWTFCSRNTSRRYWSLLSGL